MRRAGRALLALMAATIAILVLNILERDGYPPALPAPPRESNVPGVDEAFRKIVPPALSHPCPTCGECSHPVETLENRRFVRVLDRDGWYRLSWAGAETYVYDDPAYLVGALQNPTAEVLEGFWWIRARPGAPPGPPHACPSFPPVICLSYMFLASETPLEDRPAPAAAGLPDAPEYVAWFSGGGIRARPGATHFGWRLIHRDAVEHR
jgi:hypothetical protein